MAGRSDGGAAALVAALVLSTLILGSRAATVFLVSNIPSGSHAMWYAKLANLLADSGHQVVLLGTGPFKESSSDVEFIQIEDAYVWLKQVEDTVRESSLLNMVQQQSTPTANIESSSYWSLQMCPHFLQSNGTRRAMQRLATTHVDLVILDFPCESFLGFVHFLKDPPFILATPYNNAFSIFDSVGLFDNPSYVPAPFTPFSSDMSLSERVQNLYYRLYSLYLWQRYNVPSEDALAKRIFGSDTPHVSHILDRASLLLLGIDPVLTPAKPLPPALIPVGGFHINKLRPLPQDLKKFMDEAEEGVIYFSFGSNFKSTLMTPEMITTFLDTFRELPQRVVWKLELDNRTGIPDNVYISKWLPQNDILGHGKVRCFISHGGLLGTQEAVFHGVPVLGLPFMFDQLDVLNKLETNGVGIRLHFHLLTNQYIKQNIQRILHPSFRNKMQEWSRVLRDSAQTPEERALWWVEYVLRNPSLARTYLRSSSMNLRWYQRLLLDVLLTLLLPTLALVYLICRIAKLLLRPLTSSVPVNNKKLIKKSKKQ